MAEAKCKVKKCSRPIRAKQFCDRHYRAWRRGELPKPRHKNCKSEGCRKAMVRRGYCQTHLDAWTASRKSAVRLVEAAKKKEAPAAPPPPPAAVETPAPPAEKSA